jgi:hypothetical protein
VVEKGVDGEPDRTNRIGGAVCASSDASPVAWIRLAAVDRDLDIGHWLDLSLPPTFSALSTRGVRELAWTDYAEWAHTYLRPRGFTSLAEIITLTKTDRQLPNTPTVDAAEPHASGITLRSATDADLAAIVSIGWVAFEPHWWRSEATLRRYATIQPIDSPWLNAEAK